MMEAVPIRYQNQNLQFILYWKISIEDCFFILIRYFCPSWLRIWNWYFFVLLFKFIQPWKYFFFIQVLYFILLCFFVIFYLFPVDFVTKTKYYRFRFWVSICILMSFQSNRKHSIFSVDFSALHFPFEGWGQQHWCISSTCCSLQRSLQVTQH